jgi:hypothetical protein
VSFAPSRSLSSIYRARVESAARPCRLRGARPRVLVAEPPPASARATCQGARRVVVHSDDRAWSTYGAERTQTTATVRKRHHRQDGSATCDPLLTVATSCDHLCMVKSMFATACHRLPTIPYLLERGSIAWLRKGDREPADPKGKPASPETLTDASVRAFEMRPATAPVARGVTLSRRTPQTTQSMAPFRSPTRTRILSMSVASVGRHPRTAQRAKAGA